MSYGVGTCILPIARRVMLGSCIAAGIFLHYDLGVKPLAHKLMLKWEGPQPKPKSNGK